MEQAQTYDFIIAGGGSAGCVLAARLSEDRANRVLLLEAGTPDEHLWMRIPLKFRDFMFPSKFNWNYETEPEPALKNRKLFVPRGKVLGGSSSINGMIYCRCHPGDYNHWRQLGLAGWSYTDVLPYFKRSEDFPGSDEKYHGAGGPLTVSRGDRHSPAHRAFMDAGRAAGFGNTDDHNAATQDGFGAADYTIRNGERASAAQVFLKPAMSRPNLTVFTGAQAGRILFEGKRATGVEFIRDGKTETAKANREVILSGGAYNSPQVLMLSGVGPAAHLRENGIEVVHDAPDVGRHLQDHVHTGVAYNSDAMAHFTRDLRADRLALAGLNWLLFKRGHLATLPVACIGYVKTRPELATPDLELLMNRINPESLIWFPGLRKPKRGYLGTRVVLLHPESRGTVTLRSNNPLEKAVIRHNYLTAPGDIETIREGIRQVRKLYTHEPLRSLAQDELMPGANVQSDDEIDDYIRSTANMLYHPTSTCRMGIDPLAVVDAQLRVNGVTNLRVVDASVMPRVPGGHTNAPTIMIAEKAADMILGRTPLPAEELETMAAE